MIWVKWSFWGKLGQGLSKKIYAVHVLLKVFDTVGVFIGHSLYQSSACLSLVLQFCFCVSTCVHYNAPQIEVKLFLAAKSTVTTDLWSKEKSSPGLKSLLTVTSQPI